DLELDISGALVDAEALEMLQSASATRHLPARIDPDQQPCTISVLADRRHPRRTAARLAA
ncbi:MAG: hypothetical protein ACLGH7_13370, partial [Actinomycetes bacterium]